VVFLGKQGEFSRNLFGGDAGFERIRVRVAGFTGLFAAILVWPEPISNPEKRL
jgi:hypothetical protein